MDSALRNGFLLLYDTLTKQCKLKKTQFAVNGAYPRRIVNGKLKKDEWPFYVVEINVPLAMLPASGIQYLIWVYRMLQNPRYTCTIEAPDDMIFIDVE